MYDLTRASMKKLVSGFRCDYDNVISREVRTRACRALGVASDVYANGLPSRNLSISAMLPADGVVFDGGGPSAEVVVRGRGRWVVLTAMSIYCESAELSVPFSGYRDPSRWRSRARLPAFAKAGRRVQPQKWGRERAGVRAGR